MKIKIKRLHKDSVIPKYSNVGDAGMDMTAVSEEYDNDGNVCFKTGIAMEIPFGYAGFLYPRSSVAKKTLALSNSVGIVDSGYRGEIQFKFKPTTYFGTSNLEWDFDTHLYKVGERIGQIIIMPYPQIEFDEVDSLDGSVRGEGGFGSTGNK